MAPQTSTKLTYEDYLEALRSPRQTSVGNVAALLWTYMRSHHTGQVLFAARNAILAGIDAVQPAVVWNSREHAESVDGVPDLVIEVLSPSSVKLDEKIKRTRYEFFGVPEYWIVDPDAERVRVFRLRDRTLDLVAELSGDDELTSPILPGFRITAGDVFHAHEG